MEEGSYPKMKLRRISGKVKRGRNERRVGKGRRKGWEGKVGKVPPPKFFLKTTLLRNRSPGALQPLISNYNLFTCGGSQI